MFDTTQISRRAFLKAGGALVVTFALGIGLLTPPRRQAA